ncbi:alpha-glucuronidase family glycosyl hydrolase [Pseudopedobacter sp.]|uniref:alpha-glucuronidase family glycosyl hydrolase n=1 Tax=Pseudopedobacter sp. TaxID=1936787 RepID=UPI003341E5E1
MIKKLIIKLLISTFSLSAFADNGYNLWLNYKLLEDVSVLADYKAQLQSLYIPYQSATTKIAASELKNALKAILNEHITETKEIRENSLVLLKTGDFTKYGLASKSFDKTDAFAIEKKIIQNKPVILISSPSEIGLLYGSFKLLQILGTNGDISRINIQESPKIERRILNHWDNLDRTVERGYAGFSLWDWQRLPKYIDQRYIDYARANASIGINGTVLTNVNSNALILTKEWLQKVKALADTFRPYGIRVYLTARFSAPIEIGKLKTADPLDEEVKTWWKDKANEIYNIIPDFGGFLVKANSEGQPGPQNYGRNHADGANTLAKALAPHGGIVMWRAFVYDNEVPEDRAKQAYNEFKPLDGHFEDNVIIQVKNGAIDFQPREPFHPLFGALSKTNTMAEFQITQEYLGMATNLAYLAPLFKECLDADTYAKGKNSTVARVIDGSLFNNKISAIAGVSNIGNDINWCGHPLAQSNWFAFGKLAWDYSLTSEQIAREWTKLTLHTNNSATNEVVDILMQSREAVVNYMTPLGLHHLMGWDHHYGPGPWIANKPRADWTSVYYHKADKNGIGFNRTRTGSDAVDQYQPQLANEFNSTKTCPEKYLLWFHHLSWDYRLKNGETLWNGLVKKYYQGVEEVQQMQIAWDKLNVNIDPETHLAVKQLFSIQHDDAVMWRDACVLYFQQFSGKPIPAGLGKPKHDLKYYESLEFKYVPGI